MTFEFIELLNTGPFDVPLTGVKFTAGVTFDFSGGGDQSGSRPARAGCEKTGLRSSFDTGPPPRRRRVFRLAEQWR